MGEALAQNIIDIIGDKDGNLDIDVVIPVKIDWTSFLLNLILLGSWY